MSMTARIHLITPSAYDAAIRGDPENFQTVEHIDLDTAWHAIHYLITGDSARTLLFSGYQVEVSEHCEVHSPQSINSLHETLKSKKFVELMAKYQPQQFDQLDIYDGPGWEKRDADFIQAHLLSFLHLVETASDKGYGFLIVIC